jgi:hypothetical protein
MRPLQEKEIHEEDDMRPFQEKEIRKQLNLKAWTKKESVSNIPARRL